MEVIAYPDARLKTVAQEVESFPESLTAAASLGIKMMAIVNSLGAAGLAAPQVAESKRVIAVNLPVHGGVIMINPVITNKSKKTYRDREGCLSVPGQFIDVVRHKSITVEYIRVDAQLKSHKEAMTLSNLDARIVQHEVDHLDGKLFIDVIPEAKRKQLLKNYRK